MLTTSSRRIARKLGSISLLGILLFTIINTVESAALMRQDSEPEPIDKAITKGLVQIEAVGKDLDPARLAIKLSSEEPINIIVPTGTLFAPESDSHSAVVSSEAIVQTVEGQESFELLVFSLSHLLAQPSPMSGTLYRVEGYADQEMMELLEKIEEGGLTTDYGAQLAVWTISHGQTLDELVENLNIPLPESDLQTADLLLLDGETESTPGEENSDPELTTESKLEGTAVESDSPVSALMIAGILLGLVLFLALFITLYSELKKRRRLASAQRSSAEIKERPSGHQDEKQQRRLQEKPSKTQPIAAEPQSQIDQSVAGPTLQISCVEGPLQDFSIDILDGSIISRSHISILALNNPSLSTPHLLVAWWDEGVEVKDLNSNNGTEVNGQHLGVKSEILPTNSHITLGGSLDLIVVNEGLWIDSKLYPRTDNPMILSNKDLHILDTREDDKNISDAHCLIGRKGNSFFIKDLNSSNGVFLDGERMGSEVSNLTNGTKIEIGRSIFQSSFT